MYKLRLLSVSGSDRATAYNMSSKIIRRGETLFAGWLNAPTKPGAPASIMLGVCDAASGALRSMMQLGEGIDNHCGPALMLDKNGRMHAIIGAHSGAFLYRWSDSPEDAAAWSAPESLGPADTYPSLAVDAEGTLHLAHRERMDRWQLWYRRKRPGQPWEAPKSLAISPTPGYNHFMQSLTVGPTGSLHLTFQFHYAASGRASDCAGRAAVHMQSDDRGDTWFNNGVRCDSLPLTIETMDPICHHPDGGVRVGNHVVDAENHPWVFASIPGVPGGVLWHRADSGWKAIEMASAFPNLNFERGRSTSMSRDAAGHFHLAVAADPEGKPTGWSNPSQELFHLTLDSAGTTISLEQITETDPSVSHWLPALEQWDWVRRDTSCADSPWLMYTRGLNAGGIGGNNRNALSTEVYMGKTRC